MNLGAALSVGGLERAGGQQRVREANAVVVHLDDVSVDGGREAVVSAHTGCGLRDRDGRVRVRCRCGEEVSARRRQREQSTVDEVPQRLGHGQGSPRLDRDAGPGERSHDLEGEERVSPGRLVHLGQQGPRERDVEVRQHDLVQGGEIERADVEIAVALASLQLVQERALEARAAREKETDRLASESSRRVCKRPGRCRVEPLHVVDCDQELTRGGESAQGVEQCDAHRVRIGSRPLDLLENERPRERRALAGRKRLEHLVENGIEEIAEAGEAECSLTLRRVGPQDAETGPLGRLDSGPPQGRLPHTRLALEDERRCSVGDAGDEVAERAELGVPPYDGSGHWPIVCLGEARFHGIRRCRPAHRDRPLGRSRSPPGLDDPDQCASGRPRV